MSAQLDLSVYLFLLTLASSQAMSDPCRQMADRPCLPKCCPDGQGLINKNCQYTDSKLEVRFGGNTSTVADSSTYVTVRSETCKLKILLQPSVNDQDEFTVMANGSLSVPGLRDHLLGPMEYCLETLDGVTSTFLCLVEPAASAIQFILHPVFHISSVFFLLLSLLAYHQVSGLTNLSQKTVCFYLGSMAVTFTLTASIELGASKYSPEVCRSLAYIVHFSSFSTISWLTVLCCDNLWCIVTVTGAMRVRSYPCLGTWMQSDVDQSWICIGRISDEDKLFSKYMFVAYEVVAFCPPLLIIIIVVSMDLNPIFLLSYMDPTYAPLSCWFHRNEWSIAYYLLISIFLMVDFVLLSCLWINAYQFSWNPHGSHRNPHWNAYITTFLYLVMMMRHIFEIFFWIADNPICWQVADALNALQGVYIFIFFISDPRIKHHTWDRFQQNREDSVTANTPHNELI